MITSHKRRRVSTQTEHAVILVSKESKTVRQRWNKEEWSSRHHMMETIQREATNSLHLTHRFLSVTLILFRNQKRLSLQEQTISHTKWIQKSQRCLIWKMLCLIARSFYVRREATQLQQQLHKVSTTKKTPMKINAHSQLLITTTICSTSSACQTHKSNSNQRTIKKLKVKKAQNQEAYNHYREKQLFQTTWGQSQTINSIQRLQELQLECR